MKSEKGRQAITIVQLDGSFATAWFMHQLSQLPNNSSSIDCRGGKEL